MNVTQLNICLLFQPSFCKGSVPGNQHLFFDFLSFDTIENGHTATLSVGLHIAQIRQMHMIGLLILYEIISIWTICEEKKNVIVL